MKTPREILLEHHKGAVPRLDEVRRRVVERIGGRRSNFVLQLWEGLIVPVRRAWLCLGTAWVVVLALHLMSGGEASIDTRESGASNPDSVMALQRQERLMAQWVGKDEESAPDAESREPRPRSEAPVEYKMI